MSSSREEYLKKLTHYFTPNVKVNHRETPTNRDPNVNRLVNQQPYWPESAAVGMDEKVKVFVITDFTDNYSSRKKNEAEQKKQRQMWSLLLQQGIKCYVWTVPDGLKEVTDVDSLLVAVKFSHPISHQELHKELDKLKIEKRARDIVDAARAQEIAYALGFQDKEQLEINLDEYRDLTLDTFMAVIGTLPRNTIASIRFSGSDTGAKPEHLQYILEYFHVIGSIESERDGLTLLKNVLAEEDCNVRKLVIWDRPINTATLASIVDCLPEDIEIYLDDMKQLYDKQADNLSPIEVFMVLSVFSKFKNFTISGNYLPQISVKIKGKTLINTNIKIFTVINSAIDDEELLTMLSDKPAIETLVIDDCSHITGTFAESDELPQLLRTLELKNLNGLKDDTCIYRILKQNPGLSKVNLTNIQTNKAKPTLVNVENEAWVVNKDGTININALLKCTPNIEELTTNGLSIAAHSVIDNNLCLAKLKRLIYRSGKIRQVLQTNIIELLNLTPNIEEITSTLRISKHSEVNSKLNHKLNQLRHIAAFVGIETGVLDEILENSPNLEYIRHTFSPKYFRDRKNFQCDKVKTVEYPIDVLRDTKELDNLAHLFPNIEQLTLKIPCNKINITSNHETFLNLKELVLQDPISGEQLAELLKRCPNLESLELNTVEETIPDLPINNHIKKINIKAPIDYKQLEAITRSAPKVSNLKFTQIILDHKQEVEAHPIALDNLKLLEISESLGRYFKDNATWFTIRAILKTIKTKIYIQDSDKSSCYGTVPLIQSLIEDGHNIPIISNLSYVKLYLSEFQNKDFMRYMLDICPHLTHLSLIKEAGKDYINILFENDPVIKNHLNDRLRTIMFAECDLEVKDINKLLTYLTEGVTLEFDSDSLMKMLANPALDLTILKYISNSFLNLRKNGTDIEMSMERLCEILRYMQILSRLEGLYGNRYLADTFPANADFILDKLVYLDARQMSISQMLSLIPHCPNLKHIDFIHLANKDRVKEITFDLLVHICSITPNLKHLSYPETNLTYEQATSLREYFPKVTFNYNLPLAPPSQTTNNQKLIANTNADPSKVIDQLNRNGKLNLNHSNQNKPSRIDGDTKIDKNTTIHARTFFYPKKPGIPTPETYRLDVYTKLHIGEKVVFEPDDFKNLVQAKTQCEINEDLFADYKNQHENKQDVFYGSITIPPGSKGWFKLPSLSSNDEILRLSSSLNLKIVHDKIRGLHYVEIPDRLLSPLNISLLVKSNVVKFPLTNAKLIDFSCLQFDVAGSLINTPETENLLTQLSKLTEEEKIASLAKYIKKFKNKDLSSTSNYDFVTLNSIIREKKGACRHRTWAFQSIAQAIGIESHAITNDIHAFVEVFYKDQWQHLDLGGAMVNIEYDTMPEPVHIPKPAAQPAKLAIREPVVTSKVFTRPVVPVMSSINSNNRFKKWETIKSTAISYKEYCQDIIKCAQQLPDKKKNILIVADSDQIESLRNQMAVTLQERQQRLCYLHTLDDVAEKQAVVLHGKLTTPESELMKFIKHPAINDVLMTNWSDYKSTFIGYNTMMDEERKLKDATIAQDAVVIGVIDKARYSQMGEDFTSRFRLIAQCPALPTVTHACDSLTAPNANHENHYSRITFYHADWKNLLLGGVNIEGNEFILTIGALVAAIQENKPGIILENAPWNDLDFRCFINDLLLKRSFTFNGSHYHLPEGFQITRQTKPYKLNSKLVTAMQNGQANYVLNSQTYQNFIQTICCRDALVYQQDGWIKANNNREMSILVTENLPESCWAEMIALAEKHQTTLQLALAPEIKLPESMRLHGKLQTVNPSQSAVMNVYITNDLELAEVQFASANNNSTIISINTESTFSDLIERLERADNTDNLVAFNSVLGKVGKRLLKGKTVILKGTLSDNLARQLETLYLTPPYILVNGQKREVKGKLIVLSDNKPATTFIKVTELNYDNQYCWSLLDEENRDNPQYDKFKKSYQQLLAARPEIKFSYGQLRAMTSRLRQDAITNPFKPYFRLDADAAALAAAKNVWEKPKKKRDTNVMARRHSRILAELAINRYLFIAGPSGVGKSTYAINEIKKAGKDLYVGLDNIKQWLTADASAERVLFIDEANLEEKGVLDLFEGLFNTKPGLLLDGKYYPLSHNHKIVFAGNYQHFAGRYQHELFSRHGQVFNFKEMPDDILADMIIKPALNLLLPLMEEHQLDSIVGQLLKVYSLINNMLPDHPFTPRNLNMICLRLFNYWQHGKNQPDASIESLLKLAIMDEAGRLLTAETRSQFAAEIGMNENDLQLQHRLLQHLPEVLGDYFVTPSRQQPLHMLHDHFSMRDLKLSQRQFNHFDLAGLLIEGPARIGKSRIVKKYLDTHGYKAADAPDSEMVDPSKRYYLLTPTDPEKMKATLIKAFHEGSVVMIDELNGLPFEKLLNKLLSGYDDNGKRAAQPGFTIIATQNPIGYAERQVLSTAQENRFTKIPMIDYPVEELRMISYRYCQDQLLADRIVDEFLEARRYAEERQLIPAPSAGDLFNYFAMNFRNGIYLHQGKDKEEGVSIGHVQGQQEESSSESDSPEFISLNSVNKSGEDRVNKFIFNASQASAKKAELLHQIINSAPDNTADRRQFYTELNKLLGDMQKSGSGKSPILSHAKEIALLDLKYRVMTNQDKCLANIINDWKHEMPIYRSDLYQTNYVLIKSHRATGIAMLANLFTRTNSKIFVDNYTIYKKHTKKL